MSRLSRAGWSASWILAAGFTLTSTVQADALSAVQVLREGGCGGLMPAAAPLRHSAELDRAAEQWARGLALSAAVQSGGYKADVTSGLRVGASAASARSRRPRDSADAVPNSFATRRTPS